MEGKYSEIEIEKEKAAIIENLQLKYSTKRHLDPFTKDLTF